MVSRCMSVSVCACISTCSVSIVTCTLSQLALTLCGACVCGHSVVLSLGQGFPSGRGTIKNLCLIKRFMLAEYTECCKIPFVSFF